MPALVIGQINLVARPRRKAPETLMPSTGLGTKQKLHRSCAGSRKLNAALLV
jgi:hypothetical protein